MIDLFVLESVAFVSEGYSLFMHLTVCIKVFQFFINGVLFTFYSRQKNKYKFLVINIFT